MEKYISKKEKVEKNLHPEMRQVTWNRRVRSVKTERSLLK